MAWARWNHDETSLGRVRLRGVADDPLTARLRIERVLADTVVGAAGLPPSAILCIHTLADPLPGSIRMRGEATRATALWKRAVRSALDHLAQHAARPALGPVSSGAAAVLFLDQAELLGCLAADWCDGVVAGRWWWRSLFRGVDVTRMAVAAWQERPEHVPAACEQLSRGAHLVAFGRKLDAADVSVLLDRVTAAFGLPELRVELKSLSIEGGTRIRRETRSEVSPWNSRVPEASSSALRLDQQGLIGVSLMLQRAPAQVRSPMFLPAVREWVRARTSTLASSSGAVNPSGPTTGVQRAEVSLQHEVVAPHSQMSDREPAPAFVSCRRLPNPGFEPAMGAVDLMTGAEHANADASTIAHAPAEPAPFAAPEVRPPKSSTNARDRIRGRPGPVAMDEPADAVAIEQDANAPPLRAPEPVLPESSPLPSQSRSDGARSSIVTFDQSAAEAEHATTEAMSACAPAAPAVDAAPVAVPMVTAFGGLFYLINVGIFLELYGDFTAPAKPGIALSIWDFLSAIGDRLVGDRLHADPAWPMLAGLAGRQDADAPGHDFGPAHEWRMPAAWLEPFASSRIWRWSVRQRRLRVRHPAGFFVIDVPVDEEGRTPDEQLRSEMRAYTPNRRITLRTARMRVRESPSRFDWWLGHVMAYLRARLALAFRLQQRSAIGRVLIEHRARVFLTGSELHVVFALADLPIEVRLSGLDRNPGWVPAAGRTVVFHFE